MERKSPQRPKDPINLERARDRLTKGRARQGMQRFHKALCDPARLQIVQALSVGRLCVNDLALAIGRAPAATSQHLRILRDLDIVDGEREGTTVYYSLKGDAGAQLEGLLEQMASLPPASTA